MNKIAIPALLLGVVMIAGAFAFMPVQEASTVHLSAANTVNQMTLKTASTVFTPTAGQGAQAFAATINLNAPFEIVQISLECAPGGDGDDVTLCGGDETMDIVNYVVDGATNAQVLTLVALAGDDGVGGATRVLTLDAVTAGFVHIVASDNIVLNLLADTDDNSDATDDGFAVTIRVTIKVPASIAFAAGNIAVA